MSISGAKAARNVLTIGNHIARKVLDEHRQVEAQMHGAWWVARGQKVQDLGELRGGSVAKLAELKSTLRAAADSFRVETTASRRKPLAMGEAEAMAWTNLSALMAAAERNGRSADDVAQKRLDRAMREGDMPMIRAARANLPDYLEATNGLMRPDLLERLDVATGDPEIIEAIALEKEGEQGLTWAQTGVEYALAEVEGRVQAALLAPTWTGSTFDLGEPPDYAAIDGQASYTAAQKVAHPMKPAGSSSGAGAQAFPDGGAPAPTAD